ncbi:reverse transcriptase domain-containing protein [Roseibium sp.]|uniref:reverse transcriptase domain-containing protein n=1 Tax=Roseibium sp. TaxID=1936156 RepID=UPI003BAD2EF0
MTDEFELNSKDLKTYPHFDKPISLRNIKNLVTNKEAVAKHGFYPFFHFEEKWQPFRSLDGTGKPAPKIRPIRYGARRDAYIFAHYRKKLSKLYERKLLSLGIEACPIAYRQIPKSDTNSGKCNIDFAKDAFDEIDRLGDCVAIALDIRGYFDSLDHSRIKQTWADLLEVKQLPDDHYNVFKHITKYSYVDQLDVYKRLGYFGEKISGKMVIEGYLVAYNSMPKQICTPSEFRRLICGSGPKTSLIKKNTFTYGIPQGAPISDLIANFYLLDFDVKLNEFAQSRGGRYMRYSDDILIIVPGALREANEAEDFCKKTIRSFGDQLEIKDAKTCVVQYKLTKSGLQYEHLLGPQGRNGFEYLGFRYDGRKVYIRDSTLSRLYRKVAVATRREAIRHIAKNPSSSLTSLIDTFPYSKITQRYVRVKKGSLTEDYRSWTFYTYLKRAAKVFGTKGDKILPQARNIQNFMRAKAQQVLIDKKTPQ